jgi:hypothetical protein
MYWATSEKCIGLRHKNVLGYVRENVLGYVIKMYWATSGKMYWATSGKMYWATTLKEPSEGRKSEQNWSKFKLSKIGMGGGFLRPGSLKNVFLWCFQVVFSPFSAPFGHEMA